MSTLDSVKEDLKQFGRGKEFTPFQIHTIIIKFEKDPIEIAKILGQLMDENVVIRKFYLTLADGTTTAKIARSITEIEDPEDNGIVSISSAYVIK